MRERVRHARDEAEITHPEVSAPGHRNAVEPPREGHDGVDGTREQHVAAHVDHPVLIARRVRPWRAVANQAGERRQGDPSSVRRGENEVLERLTAEAATRKTHDDGNRDGRPRITGQSDRCGVKCLGQSAGQSLRAPSEKRRLATADDDVPAHQRVAGGVVDIDHPVLMTVIDVRDLSRQKAKIVFARTREGGQHLGADRWTGRRLKDLDACVGETPGDGKERAVKPDGDPVRAHAAVTFGHEIDTDLGETGRVETRVATDERSEIGRRALTDEVLVVADVAVTGQNTVDGADHAGGPRELAPAGKLDLEKKRRDVVARQHLEGHRERRQRTVDGTGDDERPQRHGHGNQKQKGHGEQEEVGPPA